MPRSLVALAILAMCGLGCSSTPGSTQNDMEDGNARICVEAVEPNGDYVPATITHNDVPFAGNCVNVDPSLEHVIKADMVVGDLIASKHTVTIAANELESGEERPVRFLYHAPDTKLLIVDTVHDLRATATPIDATIY
ncbi:MAG: hypothetical protein V3R49_01495, partial [Gammaproteobacteria bacterium]